MPCKEEGWRPRRTIVFAVWSAGEFGTVGAAEWLERHLTKVGARTVGYLGSQLCAAGPDLMASASPTMAELLAVVARDVRDPMDEQRSYYDYWKRGASGGGAGDYDDSPGGWGERSFPVRCSFITVAVLIDAAGPVAAVFFFAFLHQ